MCPSRGSWSSTSGDDLSLRALPRPDHGDFPEGVTASAQYGPRESGGGLSQCAAAHCRGPGGVPICSARRGFVPTASSPGARGRPRSSRRSRRGSPRSWREPRCVTSIEEPGDRLSRRRQGPMAAYRLDDRPDLVSGVGQTRRPAQGLSRRRHRPRPFRALLCAARGVRHAAHATPITCANSRP